MHAGTNQWLQCLREKRLLVHLLLVQVAVEDHRHVADEDAAERRYADLAWRERYEALFARLFEAFEFRLKIFVERNAELGFDFVLWNHRVAEQAADHRAAQAVVRRKAVATHRCDASLGDR